MVEVVTSLYLTAAIREKTMVDLDLAQLSDSQLLGFLISSF